MNNTNKDCFINLRVSVDMRKSIYNRAKDLEVSVSELLRDIISENI